MPKLEWNALAIADLLAIVDYISDDDPNAAQALKDEIEAKTSHIPENPRLYRVGRVVGTRDGGPAKIHRNLYRRCHYCNDPTCASHSSTMAESMILTYLRMKLQARST